MPHRPSERLPELRAVLALCCGKAELIFHEELAWHSATFSGTRHTIGLQFTGGEAVAYGEALIDELPDHEFALAGKVVANAVIVAADRRCLPTPETLLAIELLVLDDQ